MNLFRNHVFLMLLLFSFLLGCNLEKEIEIALPQGEDQLVVECYLEPGRPFSLLLTRSNDYFAPFPEDLEKYATAIFESNAVVTIKSNGKEYVLKNVLRFDLLANKIYNYTSPDLVPADLEHDFELNITTGSGKTIQSQTRILPAIPLDSLVVQFEESQDTLARVLTYFTDNPATKDFYRRMLHWNSLDSIPEQDFPADDRIVDKNTVVFGTGYEFPVGDTVINTLYHIDQAYYDFLRSIFDAIQGNTNPFAQPSPIVSNMKGNAGAIGIFTGLTYTRDTVIIRK